MTSHHYRIVDVFTTEALQGNALAVFPDGSAIDGDIMQRIAREMNLSETVFVLPPTRSDCAAKLRIFTPTAELIFAGHPTVGTSFVMLDEGMVSQDADRFVLEEGVGPVPIRVERGNSEGRPLIWLTTPPITFGRTYDRAACAAALGIEPGDLLEIDPQFVTAGNDTIYTAVKSKAAVDRSQVDLHGLSIIKGDDKKAACVFVFTPTPDGAYSRMFAPDFGIIEDPATGSSTGPLAAYMLKHGLAPGAAGSRFFSEQGVKMGRRSILFVELQGENGVDGIDVGGYVTPLAEGTMTF